MSPTPFLTFFVPGDPVPQGSKRAWLNRQTGHVMMREDQGDRHLGWRLAVTAHAQKALADAGVNTPASAPLSFLGTFYFRRGLGHYGTGKNERIVKASAPPYPHRPPDLDKLVRAIFDALTDAKVWVDDGLVVSATIRKRWVDRWSNETPGVLIAIGEQP